MKFFSLAIVATLACAVTVSAAPSSVDELALGSLGNIFQQIKERMQEFKCTTSVVLKALAAGGLKDELNEFKKLGEAISMDFVMCNLAGPRPSEIIKCQFEVVKALPEYFTGFFESLSKNHKELVDKIRQQIETECKPKTEPDVLFNYGVQLSLN